MPDAPPCILVVESDVLVRHALAEYLRECGYIVLEALNATEGRHYVEHHSPQIDIALVDVSGKTDGFNFAHWLRAQSKGLEVVLVGTVEKATKQAGDLCEEGPDLAKPYDHKFVLDYIRRLIAARARNRNHILKAARKQEE